MANLQYLKDVAGTEWLEDFDALIDVTEAAITEVETARQGQANLNTKITAMDNATTAVTNEVTTARQGQASLNAKITAMDLATTTVTNEVVAGRQGQATLNEALDLKVPKSGFTAHFSAQNYRINTLADAVNPQDAVNLQQVQSLISGGGSPSNIAVTSLNLGTATSLQVYRVDAEGSAIEGVTLGFSDLDVGMGVEGEYLKIENNQVISTNDLTDKIFYANF